MSLTVLCAIPLVLQGVVLISMVQTCVICMCRRNSDDEIIEKATNTD